jgi:hypothetical protein
MISGSGSWPTSRTSESGCVALCSARVSVCRGGHKLAKLRHHLDRVDVALTRAEWQACWQAKRWFLTADGDATKRWGNETIRVDPEQQWLELRLPTTMAALSNTSGRACTYRLACPVIFHHRRDEWAVQAASGSVRYDISYRPDRNRWYLDASWQTKAVRSPTLDELRRSRALGVDLNAEHLDCWVLDASGNPVGSPHTIPLHLDTLSASTRDGRLRAAIAAILRLAQTNGCRSIVIEDLDFTDARQTGRETLGRGRRARWFRQTVAGMPARRFRTFLAGMAANADLWVIAVDPGWTSKWGRRYWQTPLHHTTKSSIVVTRHHAAAVVIARRGLGVGPGDGQVCPVTTRGSWLESYRPGRTSSTLTTRDPDHREASGRRARRVRPAWLNGPVRRPGGPRPFGTTGQVLRPAQLQRNGARAQPPAHHLADAVGLHRDPVEGVGGLHGAALVADD